MEIWKNITGTGLFDIYIPNSNSKGIMVSKDPDYNDKEYLDTSTSFRTLRK